MANCDMSFYLNKTSDLLFGLLEDGLSLQEDSFFGKYMKK